MCDRPPSYHQASFRKSQLHAAFPCVLMNPTPSEHTCPSPIPACIQPGCRQTPPATTCGQYPALLLPHPPLTCNAAAERVSIKSTEAAPPVPRVQLESSGRGMEGSRESPQRARGLGQIPSASGPRSAGRGATGKGLYPAASFHPHPDTCPTAAEVHPSWVTPQFECRVARLAPQRGAPVPEVPLRTVLAHTHPARGSRLTPATAPAPGSAQRAGEQTIAT